LLSTGLEQKLGLRLLYVTHVLYLEKGSGPEVQVFGRVANK